MQAHVGINATRFKRLLQSCATLGRDLRYRCSAVLHYDNRSTTQNLRMLPTPSCTHCAVASRHWAQCSCRLKHMYNYHIAHFSLAGSNLLPAHPENFGFSTTLSSSSPIIIRQSNDPNTSLNDTRYRQSRLPLPWYHINTGGAGTEHYICNVLAKPANRRFRRKNL